MDESKYLELRDALRARAKSDSLNREFIRRFVLALEADLNREAGREKKVYSFGKIDEVSGFQKATMSGYASTIEFAIQVEFHDESGTEIFQYAVPLKAKFGDDELSVYCFDTEESVVLSAAECATPQGRKAVADLLEVPIVTAVNDMLRKLAYY